MPFKPQIGFDPDGEVRYLGSCLALATGYVQAMLFTMAVLVLIQPSEVTKRRVVCQVVVISLVDAILLGAFFILPLATFFYVYELFIILYLAQLVIYTRWYLRCYRHFVGQISAYYEEDEIERSLRWLGVLFWAALAVGVLSLLMLIGNRTIDAYMTLSLALFYTFLAVSFINYQLSSPVILPALESGETNEKEEDDKLPDRLMGWIERGGYLDTQKSVVDIACELEMSLSKFHAYFINVAGEDFRTWRVRKRIYHAQQLMDEHPDWPMTRIARESGFNDRSWFYKQFLHFTGQTVTAYKRGSSHQISND